MSSDNNVFERLFKLWASICKLILDGKRDAGKVADILQGIVDEANEFLVDYRHFLHTGPGLWVSEDFRTRVLIKATTSPQPVPLKSYTLERNMTDTEIEQVLGQNHLFTEAEFCATIAKLIQEQWGGKAGQLLNNGHANLFYTGFCVVNVYWDAVDREWLVSTWRRRGGRRWDAGGQAFSPATAA